MYIPPNSPFAPEKMPSKKEKMIIFPAFWFRHKLLYISKFTWATKKKNPIAFHYSDCLIGILEMVYFIIIPMYLGSIILIYPKQQGFFHCSHDFTQKNTKPPINWHLCGSPLWIEAQFLINMIQCYTAHHVENKGFTMVSKQVREIWMNI